MYHTIKIPRACLDRFGVAIVLLECFGRHVKGLLTSLLTVHSGTKFGEKVAVQPASRSPVFLPLITTPLELHYSRSA